MDQTQPRGLRIRQPEAAPALDGEREALFEQRGIDGAPGVAREQPRHERRAG